MPYITIQLTTAGPLLDIQVGVSQAREDALRKASRPVPAREQIRALVDTGANCTCIDRDLVDRLGIAPTGRTSTLTASTGSNPHVVDLFDVAIGIPINGVVKFYGSVPVLALDLSSQGFHALIGQDILGHALLIYDGKGKSFTLAL